MSTVDSKARDVNMKVEDVISIKEIFDSFDEDKTGTLELEETQMQKVQTGFFTHVKQIMMHYDALHCIMYVHVQCQDVSSSLSAAFLATLKSFPITGAAPLQSLRSSKTLPWGYSHRNSGRLLRQSSVKLRENMWDMNEISVKTIENLEVNLGWLRNTSTSKRMSKAFGQTPSLCFFVGGQTTSAATLWEEILSDLLDPVDPVRRSSNGVWNSWTQYKQLDKSWHVQCDYTW